AVMVPTEILSQQHFENFIQWFSPLGIEVILLNGKMSAKEKREALDIIGSNEHTIVIGTHALFQEKVNFCNLGLVIVDEQHRFGVEQRLKLSTKNAELNCHQ